MSRVKRHFDAVVFDCDGVLVDSEILAMRVSQRLLADLGWHVDIETMMQRFVGCSREHFVTEAERELGRPLGRDWDVRYSSLLADAFRRLQPVPGIIDALAQLELPAAVASNSGHTRIRASLETVGLLEQFAGRISCAEDVAQGKPAPDVYLQAAMTLGAAPRRCIAVDDSRFGVLAAYRAGMHVLAYSGHAAISELPASERVIVFDDMRHLPDLIDSLVRSGAARENSRGVVSRAYAHEM